MMNEPTATIVTDKHGSDQTLIRMSNPADARISPQETGDLSLPVVALAR
jgi:hypothetical protein